MPGPVSPVCPSYWRFETIEALKTNRFPNGFDSWWNDWTLENFSEVWDVLLRVHHSYSGICPTAASLPEENKVTHYPNAVENYVLKAPSTLGPYSEGEKCRELDLRSWSARPSHAPPGRVRVTILPHRFYTRLHTRVRKKIRLLCSLQTTENSVRKNGPYKNYKRNRKGKQEKCIHISDFSHYTYTWTSKFYFGSEFIYAESGILCST